MKHGNSNGNGNADFDLFWARYPRHVAKQDALKAWLKLKPSPELLGKMLAALDWQREVWDDPEYVPYPASWLRGQRWDDEPMKPKTGQQTNKNMRTAGNEAALQAFVNRRSSS